MLHRFTYRIFNNALRIFEYYRGLPETLIDNPNYVIQPFTGFIDINQKPIYEGDCVSSLADGIEQYAICWDSDSGMFIMKDRNLTIAEAWEQAHYVYENVLLGSWQGQVKVTSNIFNI